MKMNAIRSTSLLLVCAAIVGCQTMPYQPYARDVKRKPRQSGVIALKLENRPEDQAKAQQMMKTNCGELPVKVLEEGEVAVGQKVDGTSDTDKGRGTGQTVGTIFGVPVVQTGTVGRDSTTSSSVTTAIKEWQISYECEVPAPTGKVKR